MFLHAALATAFLRGATASNVTTALCSWLGGACQPNASECAAGAAFVSMNDICGGSGFGCCLGARTTRAPTAAPTNATSSRNSCDRRFERGLRPLAKLYFDEECVVALDLNKYNCPMNALNAILKEYIGGLRVEAFWLSFLSLIALICILQLGGIPRATGGLAGSPSRAGTVVWTVYLIAFILQLLALILSVIMMAFSYVLMRREFRPCMKSFGRGAKILDVAAVTAFVFIPPVFFRLAVIWVTMVSIHVTIYVYIATATEGESASRYRRYNYVYYFMSAISAPLMIVGACFALYVLSGSVVFSISFFLPLGQGMVMLPVISCVALYFIKSWSLGSETPFGQGLARMVWWVDQPKRAKDTAPFLIFFYALLATVLLCPIIVFGILAAAYVYSGNSNADNMHPIATMYEYAFQIFWLGKFSFPNFALDFHRVEDAFTYLAGFSAIDSFTVQEYFAGAHAFDTINFIISILKAVVAYIALFVAWYWENLGLKPNVGFDVGFKYGHSISLRERLIEIDADSKPTKTLDADDDGSSDVAVKPLDDKVVKRLDVVDGKVGDIEERLELLEKKKEDAKACAIS